MCFPPTYRLKIHSPLLYADITSTFQEQSQEANYAVASYCQIPTNILNMPKPSELFWASIR